MIEKIIEKDDGSIVAIAVERVEKPVSLDLIKQEYSLVTEELDRLSEEISKLEDKFAERDRHREILFEFLKSKNELVSDEEVQELSEESGENSE